MTEVGAATPTSSALTETGIRTALLEHLRVLHGNDPDSMIIEELGLCEGAARVDVAVVNGAMAGFEIKSDFDTLERLPRQRRHYGRVLDSVTIVVGPSHLATVKRRVPPWWGVMCARVAEADTASQPTVLARPTQASEASAAIRLESIRAAGVNPKLDPYALAQLLWREEALDALRTRGLARGLSRASRPVLWRRLAESVPLPELCTLVRSTLRARGEAWRAGGRSA